MKKGIDVSQHQGTIDFKKVKNKGIDFVVLRAGFGRYVTQVDTTFETNYANCKKNSIDVGVYWYSYAKNTTEAMKEANTCLQVIAGKEFEYPIFIDLEESLASLGRTTVSAIANAFCNILEQAGYYPGIYMSRSPAQSYLTADIQSKYPLWLAEYADKLNWTGPAVGMWQWSSTGTLSGINGDVDMDICYVDYPSIIKNAGLNGYAKPLVNAKEESKVSYMTYDEFEKKYLGKAVDYDGVAGVQCVDLADQYLKDCFGIQGIWVNGARDFYNNFTAYTALVKAFDRIPNTRDLIVQKGDIVIWGKGMWGHVGIGTGVGDIDKFECIEQNTLGKHEATQKVMHTFNGVSGVDACNPVLGVLRPKKTATTTLEMLDATGLKEGDKTVGVLAYKQLLILAHNAGIINQKVDNNLSFGPGTTKATNEFLGLLEKNQNGMAGEGVIKALGEKLKEVIKT